MWREHWQALSLSLAAVAVMTCAGPQHVHRQGLDRQGLGGLPHAAHKVQVALHQMRSTRERPYSLFEYEVPTPSAVPHILAIDAQDQVWFSESGGRFARNFLPVPPQNKIGRLDQNGTISEWSLGIPGSSPMGVVFDRDGTLWVAERLGNRITRIARNGAMKSFAIPTPGAWPTGIALDSHGDAWFTETKGDKIAVVSARTGALAEFALPKTHVMATGIAVDREDRIWIAMRDVNEIGLFDPGTKTFKEFLLPTKDAKPCGVAVDAEGKVWFSERNGGKIGTVDPGGTIQEFALPERFGGPFLLIADRQGSVWFSELFSNRIGRFDPRTQQFEHFPLPGGERAYPAGLALDSKGNVWYAQQASNRIGVVVRADLSYVAGEAPKAASALRVEQQRHEIHELDVPTPQAFPGIVGTDRNGTVWFTQMGGGWVSPGFPPGPPGDRIGYVRDGVLHELTTPTPESGPTSMAVDPCSDDVWVTLRAANKIALVRDFKVSEFDIPVPNSLPVGITVDRDHNVFVALSDANRIAMRSPDGQWRLLVLPEPDSQPRTVYVDSRNTLWFAEKVGNHIGRLDRAKWQVERWPLPTHVGWPLSLIEDGQGNIWFAEMRSDKLAMFDRKTEQITEYALPVQSAPFKLLYDPEHRAMWVSTVFASSILRFDLEARKVVSSYRIPSEGAWVGGLDFDAHKCIWFSEQFANKVAQLCIEGVSSVALGPPGELRATRAPISSP